MELVEAGAITPCTPMGLEQRRIEAAVMIQVCPDEIFLVGQEAKHTKRYSKNEIVAILSIVLALSPRHNSTEDGKRGLNS